MEAQRSGPPTEQVDPAAPQLARAGAGEEKADAPLLDESMHLVQEIRQPLDLVDDHDLAIADDLLLDAAGFTAEGQIGRGIQEIVDPHAGKRMGDERRLPRLPWTEEEVRLLFDDSQIEHARNRPIHLHRRHCRHIS
jgi:hypothetical protein